MLQISTSNLFIYVFELQKEIREICGRLEEQQIIFSQDFL